MKAPLVRTLLLVLITVLMVTTASLAAMAREAESGGWGGGSSGGGGNSWGGGNSGGGGSPNQEAKVEDSSSGRSSSPDNGLRGDGTVDDNLPRNSGLDDTGANGVEFRWNGTVDDNLPRNSSQDNFSNNSGQDDFTSSGVQLRGDGTVDDNSFAIFNDIGDNFAKDDIVQLVSRGAVRGFDDGTFRPNQPITRSEFLKVTMRSLGLEGSNGASTNFQDVSDDELRPLLSRASEMGAVSGQNVRGRLVFRPDDEISRAEAVTIVAKLSGIDGSNAASGESQFADVGNGPNRSVIEDAHRRGIVSWVLTQEGTMFRPNDDLSRAEAAKIVNNALELESVR